MAVEEKKDSVPPIPPNCPYFGDDRKPFSFNFMENFHPWTPEFSPYQKVVIASVARCVWLDIGRQLKANRPSDSRISRGQINKAFLAAEDWKLWGEQK